MRLATSLVVAALWLGCGRGGLVGGTETTQPITSTTGALAGTWALGADTIKGLPGPDDTVEKDGSPYAMLTLHEDGTFDLWFGAGCVVQGISGSWAPTTTGGHLSMTPDDWQTWTDGVSEPLRPTQLDAARDGDFLRITGVDEKLRPIDQRWRPYAP